MNDNDKPKGFPDTPNLLHLLENRDKVKYAREFVDWLDGIGYGLISAGGIRMATPKVMALKWIYVDPGDLNAERELVRDWGGRAKDDGEMACNSAQWQLVDLVTRGDL
jgi:hypothetical protein